MVKSYPVSKLQFIADAAGGLRSGVVAYNVPFGMVVGNEYLLAANVQEFYGMTEVGNVSALIDKGVSSVPSPAIQTLGVLRDASCDALQLWHTGEDYEGMLVKVERVVITENRPAGASFLVARPGVAPTDTILIDAMAGNFTYAADSGHIATITGVLHFAFGTFRICPRSDSDIQDLGTGPVFSARLDVSRSGTASRDPELIRDGNGNLFLAWGRDPLQVAYSLSLDDGLSWSAPKGVPRQGRQPALAVADSNKLCVLGAGLDSLRFHQSVDGGFQLLPVSCTVDAFRAEYPQMAVGSGGHIHTAWERYQAGIYYSRSLTGGASFSTPTVIALDSWPQDRHSLVRICASRGDSVYLSWEYQKASGPPNSRILFSRSLNGGSSFSQPKAISDTTKYVRLGDEQVDSTGVLYVMWVNCGPPDSVVFLRSTNGGASFTTVGHPFPGALALSGICAKSFVLGPSGAVHAIVGVCSTDLYYTHSSDGGANWDPAVNLTNGVGSVGEPRGAKIILDRSGVPVVVWFGTEAGSSEIRLLRKIN
jgi:hypothetical protein